MAENIILIGVLFMGGFVGFVLALSTGNLSNLHLKSALTIIGAALSGAPVFLMDNLSHQKWMYPIGLVIGFLFIRLIQARNVLVSSEEKNRLKMIFAWFDMIAIITFILVVILSAAFI